MTEQVITLEGNTTTMDQHEPIGTTNSNKIDNEISAAHRILNGTGNFLKNNKNKAMAVLAAGALTITLAGCGANASAEGPRPSTSTSAEETPTATPSEAPTTTPEATPETNKFTGVINYEKLTGDQWEALNPLEQQAVCSEFFASNIENEPKMTAFSTGVEVAQWFADRLDVVQSLAKDESNPLNLEASLNIADCLTLDYITSEDTSPGREYIKGQIADMTHTSIEGVGFVHIDPKAVTRYSDGTFPATAQHELSYAALAIEGHENNGIGNQPGVLVMNYFQWAPDEGVYRLVMATPTEDGGQSPYFGKLKPPIVLDPSRQNAPNTLD